jgi:membrane protein DedA with SNARE-associated domain
VSSTLTALVTLFVVAFVPLAPTEPVLVGMGVFAASGRLPLLWVVVVAAVACTLSDHLLYAVGRIAGARALRRLSGKPSVAAAADWLTRRLARWGAPILVLGRWLPGGGTAGAILTGTLRWPLARFTPASVVGSTLWSAYVAMIGYLGGALTGSYVTGLLVSLAIAAALAIGSSILIQRAHHRAHTTEPTAIGDGTLISH